jgi:hypothetical protein
VGDEKRVSDLSAEELRADRDSMIKSLGLDVKPPPQIRTFER